MTAARRHRPLGGRAARRAGAGALLLAVALAAAAQAGAYFTRPLPAGRLAVRPLDHRIDLNTADAATLELLPGIGPVTARRIVAHRQRAGGFPSIEALQRVSGVGPVTLRRVRPYLRPIGPPPGAPQGQGPPRAGAPDRSGG